MLKLHLLCCFWPEGFKWDSSISEQYPTTTSPSASELLWPYTMDYGLPQDCSIRWEHQRLN